MTKKEVAKLLAFIAAVYPNIDIREGTVEAWYELVGDLPFELAMAGLKKVIAEQEYPGLPAVGKLRQAVADLMTDVASPVQAWEMVIQAVRRYGVWREEEALSSLHDDVRRAVSAIGWREICCTTEPEIVRSQFLKIYQQTVESKKKEYVLPPGVGESTEKLMLEGKKGAV